MSLIHLILVVLNWPYVGLIIDILVDLAVGLCYGRTQRMQLSKATQFRIHCTPISGQAAY